MIYKQFDRFVTEVMSGYVGASCSEELKKDWYKKYLYGHTAKSLRNLLKDIPNDAVCVIPNETIEDLPSGKAWIEWFISLVENMEDK